MLTNNQCLNVLLLLLTHALPKPSDPQTRTHKYHKTSSRQFVTYCLRYKYFYFLWLPLILCETKRHKSMRGWDLRGKLILKIFVFDSKIFWFWERPKGWLRPGPMTMSWGWCSPRSGKSLQAEGLWLLNTLASMVSTPKKLLGGGFLQRDWRSPGREIPKLTTGPLTNMWYNQTTMLSRFYFA